MSNTIDDLKVLRDQLVERRRDEAYMVGNSHHDERIEKLVRVHLAIAALDAVIVEGKDGPPPREPRILVL
ncbi:hypothetical protein [Ancylobacter polymorphus]|uniref:Uncharacterized protein n=1 Tax=Ancylobacter polymorphus TaxID=223390 RepID=A0A9E7CWU8_9HYPH|nr:hypothetical protein [Ancylobacter polymorphus]UOK71559.1 hypothetical protein K9D25_02215 [Ancylobacter polymorphus]